MQDEWQFCPCLHRILNGGHYSFPDADADPGTTELALSKCYFIVHLPDEKCVLVKIKLTDICLVLHNSLPSPPQLQAFRTKCSHEKNLTITTEVLAFLLLLLVSAVQSQGMQEHHKDRGASAT